MILRRPAILPGWPTLLLVLVNVAVVSAGAMRLWQGSTARSILATPPQRTAPPVALREPTANFVDLSGIQSAALFHESRSFYIPPAIPAVRARPDYRLSATWRLPKQPTTAVLIQNQSGARIRVQPGAEVEGWTVESIDTQIVILRDGEQQIEIRTARTALGSGMQPASSSTSGARPSGSGIRLLGRPFTPR